MLMQNGQIVLSLEEKLLNKFIQKQVNTPFSP
jgi:hypothetical protein